MRALLEYMYTGEVNVTQSQIPRIMRIAEQLEVKGLFDMTELRQKFKQEEPENLRSPVSYATSAAAHSSQGGSPPAAPIWPSSASFGSPLYRQLPTALSASYDTPGDMNPLKRKKLSSISSMLMSRDTPILRNVLAQTSAADSSQPAALVCQPVTHSERLHSNGSSHDSFKVSPIEFDFFLCEFWISFNLRFFRFSASTRRRLRRTTLSVRRQIVRRRQLAQIVKLVHVASELPQRSQMRHRSLRAPAEAGVETLQAIHEDGHNVGDRMRAKWDERSTSFAQVRSPVENALRQSEEIGNNHGTTDEQKYKARIEREPLDGRGWRRRRWWRPRR